MVQVNLIGRKRKAAKSKNWAILVAGGLFVAFVIYFLASTLYVFIRLTITGREIMRVDEEAVAISREISANDELLTNYVLSKSILTRIGTINRDKFHYLDYLNEVVTLMPTDVVLKNVDFAVRGWVAVTASLPNVEVARQLENNLSNPGLLEGSRFSTVFSEGLTRDRSGSYNAKLQFQIQPDGR